MKFSIKLFKIQTKISVSSLILSSVVGGAVAMAGDELENGSRLPQVSHVDGVYDSPLQKSGGLASRLSYDSDISDSPATPVSRNTRVTSRPDGAFASRVVAPEGFKPKTCGNTGLAASFKKQLIMSPEKFGQAISASQGVVNARQILERYKKKKASMPSQEVQTDDLLELTSFLDILAEWRSLPLEDVDYEVQDFSAADMHVSPKKVQDLTDGAVKGRITDADEEIVSVDYQSAIVRREPASSQGVLITSNYRAGSTLFAGIEEEFSIAGVSTSYKDMLSATDVTKANEYYTYLGYYADGMELEGEDLRDYCEALLEQDPDSFLGENIDTAWSFLERKVKEAVDYLPGFHKVVIKKDKVKNACIKKNLEEAQSISVLKDEYGVLIDILRGVFSSDLSSMFANSQEIAGFQSAHWTPATISQGFKFLAAQCIQFHRTNYDLTQSISLLTRSNAGFEEQIRGYSLRQGELVSVASTNAQTIDRLAREKSQLEQRLQVLQQELDGLLPIRAEVAHLKKINAMLTRELGIAKGKPFASAKLKEFT